MKPTMMTYIQEEQAVTEGILGNYPGNVEAFANLAADNKTEWLILATGSSINAALSAKYYIEKVADVRIDVKEPFNFTHYVKSVRTAIWLSGSRKAARALRRSAPWTGFASKPASRRSRSRAT